MSSTGKAMHLAVLFPSNQSAYWRDPRSGDHSDFATFSGLARTAERGLFDFFLLADYPGWPNTAVPSPKWAPPTNSIRSPYCQP